MLVGFVSPVPEGRRLRHDPSLQRSRALELTHAAADVAELADALVSGTSGGNPLEVRLLSSALLRGTKALGTEARRENGKLGATALEQCVACEESKNEVWN